MITSKATKMEITLKELADAIYDNATVELADYFDRARKENDSDIVVDEMKDVYDFTIIVFGALKKLSPNEDIFNDYKDENIMSLRDYLTESVMAGFPA